MTADLRIDHYDWAGGREAMLRFGPDEGPVVVVALPLFEEANRTRAFAVAICRALARRGIASVLPDMPGQGDSLVPLATVTLATFREAHRALIDRLWAGSRHSYALGIRSGALLDAESRVHGRWYLAPQDGRSLLRELARIRQAALGSRSRMTETWFIDSFDQDGADIPVEIAGNALAPALLRDLLDYSPPRSGRVRTIALTSDPAPADHKVDGAPLWRRSEPGQDQALAALLADDIGDWIAQCES